jgi:phosphatidylglycerophosphate synthase
MPESGTGTGARRYLKSREKPWAQALARWIGTTPVTPNMISVASVLFSIASAVCLVMAGRGGMWEATALWIGAAAGIQFRLLCNLLDGMVAIEGGRKSATGGLYNEVPDRIADPLLLIAAGYSGAGVIEFRGIPLGWAAAVLAVMTAYIRVLGGTLGTMQSFAGPMAKQHRMAVLTLACFGSIAELWLGGEQPPNRVMTAALAAIVLGSVVTCWRRLRLIGLELRKHALTTR